MTRLLRPALVAAAAAVLLAGCAATPADPATPADDSPAAAYCAEKGGHVEWRQPTYGTNNDPATWVKLGEPVESCRFSQTEDGNETSIFVDLDTLYSENPTLAALAYLAKSPLPAVAPANPASQSCIDLGGAVAYGDGPEGGGLVLEGDTLEVVAVCTFADGSFIDEWGIGYYSAGTVRGADLAPLFRFDSTRLPAVFSG